MDKGEEKRVPQDFVFCCFFWPSCDSLFLLLLRVAPYFYYHKASIYKFRWNAFKLQSTRKPNLHQGVLSKTRIYSLQNSLYVKKSIQQHSWQHQQKLPHDREVDSFFCDCTNIIYCTKISKCPLYTL